MWKYFFQFFSVLLWLSPKLHAEVPPVTTFQARIIAPNGQPVQAASVNFRFTILDSAGTCALYVEDYANVNMGLSEGIATFSLGSGAKVFPTIAVAMVEVFNNSAPSIPCQAGGIYTPGAFDRRQVVMQFNDGTSGWQTVPQVAINSVFFANYANRADCFDWANNDAKYHHHKSVGCSEWLFKFGRLDNFQ